MIAAATMLPISISGIGIREGMTVLLWTEVGLSVPEALSLSLVTHALVVSVGLWEGSSMFSSTREASGGSALRTPYYEIEEEEGLTSWQVRRCSSPSVPNGSAMCEP